MLKAGAHWCNWLSLRLARLRCEHEPVAALSPGNVLARSRAVTAWSVRRGDVDDAYIDRLKEQAWIEHNVAIQAPRVGRDPFELQDVR